MGQRQLMPHDQSLYESRRPFKHIRQSDVHPNYHAIVPAPSLRQLATRDPRCGDSPTAGSTQKALHRPNLRKPAPSNLSDNESTGEDYYAVEAMMLPR